MPTPGSSVPRFLGSIALTFAACDEPVAHTPTGILEREFELEETVLVFESIRVLDPENALVSEEVVGEVTPAVFQRVGRPWSYFDEEYLYHENAWSRSIEGSDNTEHGYQILRTVNPSPVVHTPDDSPTKINPALEVLLTDEKMIAAPETMIDVQVRLRDFPDWDIPLLPASIGLSAEDALIVLDERETALVARGQLFEAFAGPVVDHVEAAGAVVNGSTHANALSLADLVAPTNVLLTTNIDGANGKVDSINPFGGSSAAAPHVSGAAALLKSEHLAAGKTWINSPGRLHSIMLAHSDRHFSAAPGDPDTVTTQKPKGADPAFGLGRIKMRLLANGGQHSPRDDDFRARSFTSASADHTYHPFAGPMPTGTALVKCVMNTPEDMSDKTDISDIDLVLRVAAPVNGACVLGGGASLLSNADRSRDTKSMVAFHSTNATLAGACLEVTVDNWFVSSAGVTAMTYCYLSNVRDDL